MYDIAVETNKRNFELYVRNPFRKIEGKAGTESSTN